MSSAEKAAVIAPVVHEAMRAFRLALHEPPLPPWERAPAWMRKSTIAGVMFRIENPTAPSSAQHEQWLEEKRAAGWRHGPVKDERRKTHPSIIPYAELEESERRKDALFAAIVRAIAAPLGD